MDLPEVVMEMIFSYLSYDEVSKARQVCKEFNTLGGSSLNHGFKKVKHFHSQCLREIKDALPRRESERRKHVLYARHDVLQAVETRLSLLSMTYSRMIQNDQCCFIPGKVLDEIFAILRIVRQHDIPMPNNISLLQEMRDISSMAMEHFDEHIRPVLEMQDCCSSLVLKDLPGKPLFLDPSFLTVPQDQPSTASEPRPRKGRQSQDRRIISLLKAKVAKQNRLIRQINAKAQNLEDVTSSLTNTVHELKGQLSEVVKQVTTHQCILDSGRKNPPGHLLNPETSEEINNNFIINEELLIRPALSTLAPEKTVGKRPLTDNSPKEVNNLKKRFKY